MDAAAVREYLTGLQQRIVGGLEAVDGAPFRRDEWTRAEGGGGVSRLLEDGAVLERAGVLFSHVRGERLPPSATAQRPALAGRAWEAMGVSLVLHPRNPHAPTVHLNVRCFVAAASGDDATPVWWFEMHCCGTTLAQAARLPTLSQNSAVPASGRNASVSCPLPRSPRPSCGGWPIMNPRARTRRRRSACHTTGSRGG